MSANIKYNQRRGTKSAKIEGIYSLTPYDDMMMIMSSHHSLSIQFISIVICDNNISSL